MPRSLALLVGLVLLASLLTWFALPEDDPAGAPPEATRSGGDPAEAEAAAPPAPPEPAEPSREVDVAARASDEGEEPESPLVYDSETLAKLREQGAGAMELRWRIFGAKMDRSLERVEAARANDDPGLAQALYTTMASNLAEVHLCASGRPGVAADAPYEEPAGGERGLIISLNTRRYRLPEGELPFLDRVHGVNGPKPGPDEWLGDDLLEQCRGAVERGSLLAASLADGPVMRYPD